MSATSHATRATPRRRPRFSEDSLPFGTDSAKNDDAGTEIFSILRARMGWTDDYLREIDDPHYPELRDLDKIVKALHWVRRTGQKIVVLPDFDMDGITSGVLGFAGLSELGFDVELYVPDYRRGHDIAPEAIDELVTRHPGVSVVITCDGGVNSHPGILRGRQLGLTMLVTDHHVQLPTEPNGTVVPSAHVTIDPERIDETYPHPAICGAFVLYQVIEAYTRVHAPHRLGDISFLKLFAGLGTVSDVMPLQYENRQVVRDSLSLARMLRHSLPKADTVTPYDVDSSILMSLLNSRLPSPGQQIIGGYLEAGLHHPAFVRAFRGFAYVLQTWREYGSLESAASLRADFYGFYLAPAFNALRRIGAPMKTAFDVFTETDDDEQLAAARQIIEWNEERKQQTEAWVEEMLGRDQPLAPHVWFTDAPTGMLGLLAGKLLHEHGLPVVVVRDPGNPAAPHGGSARAPMWFPVITTLTAHGYTAVGHEQACGVRAGSLVELGHIAELLAAETAVLQAQLTLAAQAPDAPLEYDLVLGLDAPGHPKPDGSLSSIETLLEVTRRIESLTPFGHEFPRPRVRLVINLATCSMHVLGEDENHLKIVLPSGMKLLWWKAAEQLPDLQEIAESIVPGQSIVEFDVDLSLNQFMGDESPQAVVEQLVVSTED